MSAVRQPLDMTSEAYTGAVLFLSSGDAYHYHLGSLSL